MHELALEVVSRVLSPYCKKIKLGVATRIMKAPIAPARPDTDLTSPPTAPSRPDTDLTSADRCAPLRCAAFAGAREVERHVPGAAATKLTG